MRVQPKGKKGAAANYITRNRAIRKLQITLIDFRRLCILKGIYPRDPPNKKKAGAGSTAPKTFYYTKDIQYLQHEPLLDKFREHKSFVKRLNKVIGKGQWSEVKRIKQQEPSYTLDHVVKERYPTFKSALHDMDDALSMIFLYTLIPTTSSLKKEVVEECQRLANEFQLWVVQKKALRKVFVSIKGIYYQVEIEGELITWVVPHQFGQQIPADVDIKIMSTFMELYRALMGFVNFKLYHDLNLKYPPLLDVASDESGANLLAYKLEHKVVDPEGGDGNALSLSKKEIRKQRLESKKRIATLNEQELLATGSTPSTQEEEPAQDLLEDEDEAAADEDEQQQQRLPQETLFSELTVFVSRETPRATLEFILKACGGKVGWSASSGGGSPFPEEDSAITHQIVDRNPEHIQMIPDRAYVQPQWIFDSVNAGKLLPVEGYRPGEVLPAHLSPFVDYKQGMYVPSEAQKDMEAADNANMDEEEEEEFLIEGESDDGEGLEKDNEDEIEEETKPKSKDAEKKTSKANKKEQELQERKRLAKIMMSRKEQRFYNQVVHSQNKKQDKVNNLKRKKANLTKSEGGSNKKSKVASA